jgi:sarcosine oxidase
MIQKFDVIIIGLGAVGSASLYQLAKKDIKVLGIDQFSPPHTFGSSHGGTRIIRQAFGSQGEEYVPIVLRSYDIWREIEKETGKNLLTITGGLTLGFYNRDAEHDEASRYMSNTIQCAKKFNIAHKILDPKELQQQFPQFKFHGNEIGYYEEKAGFLRPELCIEAQLELAEKYGALIHKNEKILEIIPAGNNELVVKTEKSVYVTRKIVLSVGSWIAYFLPSYAHLFKMYRQVLYWFNPQNKYELFKPDKCPIFIWTFTDGSNNFLYGFPAVDGKQGGVKVATEQCIESTNTDSINREVSQQEIDTMYEMYIKNHLNVSNECIKAQTCLYTVTPDSNFIIDTHPEHSNIIIASPCSGHGFKHSAAVGEILAELATQGKSKIDISKFSLKRFIEN